MVKFMTMNIVHNIDNFIIHYTINNNIIIQKIISSTNFVKTFQLLKEKLYTILYNRSTNQYSLIFINNDMRIN